jgi:quercetin dioxygenase-like cupin family protein
MKAEAADTNGALGCFEFTQLPGRGNRLHLHPHHDETKYILEGEVEIRMGERVVTAGPGTFVFIPRGIPHSHRNPGASPVRLLDIFTPGGFEGWFAAYAATQDPEERTAINRQFGIEFLE